MSVEERKAARRAAQEAKKAANKAAWANDRRNANLVWMQREAELNKPAAEIIVEPIEVSDAGSLNTMRLIMADITQPLHRRIGMAENVLRFELAPGSLAGADHKLIRSQAYKFLKLAADTPATPEHLRDRALSATASIEARKAVQSPEQMAETRTLLRRLGVAVTDGAVDFQWPPTDVAAKLDKLSKRRRM